MSRKRYYSLVRCLCAMLCCITFLLTSFTTKAATTPVSLYGGTLVSSGEYASQSVQFSFDQDKFSKLSSLSGTSVTPSHITAGSISGHINHYSNYDSASLTIADYGHTDTVTLNAVTVDGVYYNSLDFSFYTAFVLQNIDPNKYYEIYPYLQNPSVNSGYLVPGTVTITENISGTSFYYIYGRPILLKGSQLYSYNGSVNNYLLDLNIKGTIQNPTTSSSTFAFTVGYYCFEISEDSYNANAGSVVNDSGANNKLDTNNQIAQENSDTNKDTNNKVTNFFNGFWDNLLHIFVPEDGFFSDWFSDLNDFMSQKLGFLWCPFDFLLQFLNGVYNGSGSASIVFPELTWIDGTVIIQRTEFSFDHIGGDSFQDLRDMIYFATDVILLGAVVSQFYKKVKLVFEGGGD